jgi:ERCC4-type nuclease
MRPSPISILLDSNEKGSARAKALALAVGGDPAYELAGFAELPVDLQFHLHKECKKYEQDVACEPCGHGPCVQDLRVNVELKEIPDFWQSKNTGHLGQQCLEMIAQGPPGFVAVFGSLQEVLESVPKMKMWENMSGCKKPQRRSQMDIQTDISTARAFCADATACGVPVFFLSTNHQQSFAWIISMAKNILTGPNLSSWLPRFPVEPVGYGVLCSIPGIGDVAARGLLEAYGGVGQISHEAKYNLDGLASCRVNGKALGKAKASKLAEVLG